MQFKVAVRNFLALVVKMNRAPASQVALCNYYQKKTLITTISKFICAPDRHLSGATLTFQALP